MDKLIITPKSKIHDVLEAYPELEKVLIETAPQFKKLKNPVLRKTITKVTNLSQAAVIAGLNVEDLVNILRKAAGQETVSAFEDSAQHYNTEQPDWFSEEKIVKTIDIRDMLHQGEQPVHEVLSGIKKLHEGEVLEILAPFIPAPLLDKTLSLGYRHWLKKESETLYRVYFSN